MKSIFLALLFISSTAYGQSSSACIPIGDYRILIEESLRAFYLDSLVDNQSRRIELDSARMIHMSSQYADELRTSEEITASVRKQLDLKEQVNESLRKENKTLRKKNTWGKVKQWGVAVAALVVGFSIGQL